MSGQLHVSVDEDLCVGSGQCELFCPEVFEVREGTAQVLVRTPAPELHDDVLDAVDACPTQAISAQTS